LFFFSRRSQRWLSCAKRIYRQGEKHLWSRRIMPESCRKTQAMTNTKNRDADLMFSRAKLHQTLQNYSLHSYKLVCERFERIWWRKHEEQSERKWVFVNENRRWCWWIKILHMLLLFKLDLSLCFIYFF
jgi:hypothetical protein